MSVREEDQKKSGSCSRGLGFATAALGLGVGAAALYYFLNKESPQTEGASSSNWTHERANVLLEHATDSDSYSTISEGTTTDTSINDKTFEFTHASSMESDNNYTESDYESSSFYNSVSDMSYSNCTSKSSSASDNSVTSTTDSNSIEPVSECNSSESGHSQSEDDCSESRSDCSESEEEADYAESDSEVESDYTESDDGESGNAYLESETSLQSNEDVIVTVDISDMVFENASNTESLETGYTSLQHVLSTEDDSDTMEWDVTNTSIGIPSEERSSSLLTFIGGLAIRISPRKAPQEDRLSKLRERAFRERPWTLEECSICFDVMLRDQEVMTLACTHNFHAQCIMPWLQEKQTCPNCRKHAD